VVGGGAAGTAAAWAFRRAGAAVTLFSGRPGATSLYSGAIDVEPWERFDAATGIEPDVVAFATAFEAWTLGTRPCRVATYEGVLRPARGIDTALLDVETLAGRAIAVMDVDVDGWDGAALARALSASRWAARTRTTFTAVRVGGFLDPGDAARPFFDIARLHDEPGRLERLAECLARAGSSADAWLVGPWLGTLPGTAERLRALAGKPCGETTSAPGGPAGARFDAARDALLESSGVDVRNASVAALERRDERWVVTVADVAVPSAAAGDPETFDVAVLAVGGVAAGGITIGGLSESVGARAFRLSVEAPVLLGIGTCGVQQISSIHGPDFTALGREALESIGVLAEGPSVRGAPGLFVAGDCAADRPRTVLEAVRSGTVAARAALRR
jgi:glycerol-3-phosphate dehydrogenase subunit B